jgi:hypothetical protein
MYVSAMSNELCIDDATPATGGENRLPLPGDDDLHKAGVELYKSPSAWFEYLSGAAKAPKTKDTWPKETVIYFHRSKEENQEDGEELGLSEEAIDEKFLYCGYEIALKALVHEDGSTEFIEIVKE